MDRNPFKCLLWTDDASKDFCGQMISLSRLWTFQRTFIDRISFRSLLLTEDPSGVFYKQKTLQRSSAEVFLEVFHRRKILHGSSIDKIPIKGFLWIEVFYKFSFMERRPFRGLPWTDDPSESIISRRLSQTEYHSGVFYEQKIFQRASMERRPLVCLLWMLRGLLQTDDPSGAFYEHRTLQGSFIDTNLPEIIYGCSGDFYGQKIPRVSSMDRRYL